MEMCIGVTLSTSTHKITTDRSYHKSNIVLPLFVVKKLCNFFVFDNFQVGRALKHQRGKHLSSFFKGTHEVAHEVCEFNDDPWDEYYTTITGLPNQPMPSPIIIACYKDAPDNDALRSYLLMHSDLTPFQTPQFTGVRVPGYAILL